MSLTRSRPRVLALAIATALASAAAVSPMAAQAAVTITDMGPGMVVEVSADATAAVGMDDYTQGVYRWTLAGGKQYLGRNPYKLGYGGGVPSISSDGNTIAATVLDTTGTYATEGRWTLAHGWQQLTPPLPPDGGNMDGSDSGVFGMSRDGRVVTGLYWRPGYSGGSAHGSVWTAATNMVGLPTDGGSSRVDDADRHGHVLVGWEESASTGSRMATVWVDGVKTFLDGNDGNPGEATKVNPDGTVIVGQSWDNDTMKTVAAMWRWDGATWNRTLLGVLPGGSSAAAAYALGLSDDGSVVVGMDRNKSFQFASRGFVWTAATGMVDAERWMASEGTPLHRFSVSQVTSISADGQVLVLYGERTDGTQQAHSLRVQRQDGAPAAR
jgi:uncharacterized membrane protein